MQSIGKACEELSQSLNGMKYLELKPEVFIKKCYSLRSKLVHGQDPRPSLEDVNSYAAALEIFVSHLLSVKLKTSFRQTGATCIDKQD